jgi:hypothetical protein
VDPHSRTFRTPLCSKICSLVKQSSSSTFTSRWAIRDAVPSPDAVAASFFASSRSASTSA